MLLCGSIVITTTPNGDDAGAFAYTLQDLEMRFQVELL
jgi:hypothetical protein